MSNILVTPFGTFAPTYQKLEFWPRPLVGKACKIKGWQTPDPELPNGTTEGWVKQHTDKNIGLLMGSPFPDGTLLGALDIDHNAYTRLGRAILRDPPSGRIGKKGAVFFVRISPSLASQKFKVKGAKGNQYGQVLECLFKKNICVIPPSIHPETNAPYKWIGTPLHEIDFKQLPLIGE